MRRRIGRIVGAAAAAAFVMALPAAAAAQDAELVKKGEALYAAQKCSMCHSVAGKGNKKFPLDGVGKKLEEADIRAWIVDPASMHAKQTEKPAMKMRAYKTLSEEDVNALVAYMQSLK